MISCFKNNIVVFKNNSVGLLNINVVPFLAFHHLHFLLFHSSQVASRVSKIGRLTKDLVFSKMKGGMSKVEIEKLSQLSKDRQKVVDEEEGIEMETKSENERRKIVSFSSGDRLMFS